MQKILTLIKNGKQAREIATTSAYSAGGSEWKYSFLLHRLNISVHGFLSERDAMNAAKESFKINS